MKSANKVLVSEMTVYCPYCGARHVRYFTDPRGSNLYCGTCDRLFYVERAAELNIGVTSKGKSDE